MSRASADHVASRLKEWSDSLLAHCDASIFSVSGDSAPHRDAAILFTLRRNATRVVETDLERAGALYQPAGLLLAASSRRLRLVPSESNWKAAIENVHSLDAGIKNLRGGGVGIPIGTCASILKEQLDASLVQAGLTTQPTILDDENRRVALGIALNWCMRFILAYALECDPPEPGLSAGARDLWWIRQTLLDPGNPTPKSPVAP